MRRAPSTRRGPDRDPVVVWIPPIGLRTRPLRVTSVSPGRTDTDMQRAVVAHEGGQYDADRFLRPETVARTVLHAVTAPPDADVTELSIRPTAR